MPIHTVVGLPSGKFAVVLMGVTGQPISQYMETPSLSDATMTANRLNGGCAAELHRLANMMAPLAESLQRLFALAEQEANRG